MPKKKNQKSKMITTLLQDQHRKHSHTLLLIGSVHLTYGYVSKNGHICETCTYKKKKLEQFPFPEVAFCDTKPDSYSQSVDVWVLFLQFRCNRSISPLTNVMFDSLMHCMYIKDSCSNIFILLLSCSL